MEKNGNNMLSIPDNNQSENSQEKIELTNELLKAEMEIKDGQIIEHKDALNKS
jgi:hypothetical protein